MARILLIDDDVSVRKLLSTGLARAGHEVETAEDGKSGLEKFHAAPPDIVITDILMPEKDGLETISEIRREASVVPIIAVSGGGSMQMLELLEAARILGAQVALRKPFRLQKLIKAVDDCLALAETGEFGRSSTTPRQ